MTHSLARFWQNPSSKFEPRHDKTIQVTVRPAKTQISLGITCKETNIYIDLNSSLFFFLLSGPGHVKMCLMA